ncbi:N-acetyl-gamma-glutamyl-phosphate reductase [hydrothermal vent metagenome]|uniref:N-acetyl-gamma-glutamyl-phosphate reductase n=1 Tax=hydrothermal vent metagenome TaxID=652676 RepID=A0A3B1CQ53_9ZZZZ
MKKVGIIGATGYTGGELLRLLVQHPNVEVSAVTSNQSPGKPLTERLPSLTGHYDLKLEVLDPEKISKKTDIVFIALSHTTAMEPVKQFLNLKNKVIDLSADYRLNTPTQYKKWYGTAHTASYLLKKRVYGLSEVYREQIKNASLIANPGCYPTGTLLALYPFLKAGVLDTTREIIIDAKSGVSGAGRTPSTTTHFPEVNEGLLPYNIGTHRHLPEIEQEIASFSKGKEKVDTIFTPYLLPVNRGILTTIYFPINQNLSEKQIQKILSCYKNEPFIRCLKQPPNISTVRGTNYCDLAVFKTKNRRTLLIMSAIDNLVKGAAGQAIQNMNLMMSWKETLGLTQAGLYP